MTESQEISADEVLRHVEAAIDDFAEAIRDPEKARYLTTYWRRLHAAYHKLNQSISTAMVHYRAGDAA